jgi:hypothetical protein
MDDTTITTFRSALQVCAILIQADQGPTAGLGFTQSLWHSAPADNGCDAHLLSALLQGEGYTSIPLNLPPESVFLTVQETVKRGLFSFYQCHPTGMPHLVRWGMIIGGTAVGSEQVVSVGKEEAAYFQGPDSDVMTGELVLMATRIVQRFPVVVAEVVDDPN